MPVDEHQAVAATPVEREGTPEQDRTVPANDERKAIGVEL